MAEKDAAARLRRAVQENNLFLRYTSLAWAAVLGHEETFEFLLASGHDDHEYSKDTDNNTILILLADAKPPITSPYGSTQSEHEFLSATLRMARLYYDRYPDIMDWANVEGRTALHVAALKGKEELVRMLCDFGADFDLADNEGNTPLHYASAWGHMPIVQLLIERGCQYSARNNEGFTPSDYAYSTSTRDTLQDTARTQFELNKKARRNVFAQAAARGTEWGTTPDPILGPPPKAYFTNGSRMRSGSGTSRTTNTSDSGDMLDATYTSRSHLSPVTSLSPSRRPNQLPSGSYSPAQPSASSSGSTAFSSTASPSAQSHLIPSMSHNPASALSPIATRMRERDADAMEKYKLRQRSGSGATASTDNPSTNGSSPTPEDRKQSLMAVGSVAPRRRLRPSASAAQLRTTPQPPAISPNPSVSQHETVRHRSGTSPAAVPASPTTQESATPTQSSSRPPLRRLEEDSADEYTGPPSQYADFPAPPPFDDPIERTRTITPTTANGPALSYSRRLPFNLLSSHKSSTDSTAGGHRRNASVNAAIR
ncbi:ankyrin repeat-containing domain protein [Fomitopsis serialis]|uniref:ankyrin repeat-containing domain protein n=1 Tax=Fomitopsis serialis TaxID=139415 RepID=UPI0020072AEF|nr:ankyrin repeat-containing domain protein [Neoantrodia serialis]KAH9938238.1 ankyrin repeat-containing domain protein [Neoantrodia serialis]